MFKVDGEGCEAEFGTERGAGRALLALGLLPQEPDGKDSGGFMGRNGALRGGRGDALRGLTRKLEPGLGDWDNTLGLVMRGEGTEEGEDDCATLSQSEKEGRLCGSERQGGGSSQLCLFFFAGLVWKDLRWPR